ncbi:MAG: phosphonate ABC transporter, permease protein PhnE [Meiothermus sp.]|uniref:phosphonate ABC transporter, permease protein PhnE n=1 Tax=Meiothermus sp. TaxID=1955249 RepID=UPI0025FAECA1|nr:phosphonate ABC transporter, permease protein PhnE [Meiothermus sp.]MCS7193364.1 phosphonate ABC transporter, permease protein PhnE [Meiothermus sp.]MDW8091773.1 phosphonate ABC transporter, permease protein PhnE [Meiothermus sp.]
MPSSAPSASSPGLPPVPEALRRRKRTVLLLYGGIALALALSAGFTEANPLRLAESIGKSLAFSARFLPPSLDLLPQFLRSLGETIIMGFWGSVLATFLAVPLAFLGARNVVGGGAVYYLARGAMDVLRGLNELVLALVFVAALGLGPLPGILALTLHTAGVVGKLLSEAIETVDPGQVEAVRATGAHPLAVILYGIWPQVAPHFTSYTLYHFEVNVRSATVLGLVGAGGIGFDLMQTVRSFRFQDAATVILLIVAAVFVIDKLSARLRRALV